MQETGVASLTSDPGWVWCQNFKNSESLGPLISLVVQMVENPPTMRRPGFDPWVGKIPWRRAWQPTPVFLPGESHGPRSLAGYSPWGHKESDMTERLSLHLPCSRSGHSDSLRWCLGECSQCLFLWLSFEFLLFPVKLLLFTRLFIKCGLMELLGFVLNWVTISFQPHSASLRFFPTAWVGVWDTPGSLQCV